MLTDSIEPCLNLHPHERGVQVRIDGTLLADATQAIELRERGYPPRQYSRRDDARMDLLTRSETVTHCPFKGDDSYFLFGDQQEVAWSYEQPLERVEAIERRSAFYKWSSE